MSISDPWRSLMASIAMQAVRDIEAASKLQDRILQVEQRRAGRAEGRLTLLDERLLQRWSEFYPESAVWFFRSPFWSHISQALGMDDGLPVGMMEKVQRLEDTLTQIEALRAQRNRRHAKEAAGQ